MSFFLNWLQRLDRFHCCLVFSTTVHWITGDSGFKAPRSKSTANEKVSAMPMHQFLVHNDLQQEGVRLEMKTTGSIKYTKKLSTQMWSWMQRAQRVFNKSVDLKVNMRMEKWRKCLDSYIWLNILIVTAEEGQTFCIHGEGGGMHRLLVSKHQRRKEARCEI